MAQIYQQCAENRTGTGASEGTTHQTNLHTGEVAGFWPIRFSDLDAILCLQGLLDFEHLRERETSATNDWYQDQLADVVLVQHVPVDGFAILRWTWDLVDGWWSGEPSIFWSRYHSLAPFTVSYTPEVPPAPSSPLYPVRNAWPYLLTMYRCQDGHNTHYQTKHPMTSQDFPWPTFYTPGSPLCARLGRKNPNINNFNSFRGAEDGRKWKNGSFSLKILGPRALRVFHLSIVIYHHYLLNYHLSSWSINYHLSIIINYHLSSIIIINYPLEKKRRVSSSSIFINQLVGEFETSTVRSSIPKTNPHCIYIYTVYNIYNALHII